MLPAVHVEHEQAGFVSLKATVGALCNSTGLPDSSGTDRAQLPSRNVGAVPDDQTSLAVQSDDSLVMLPSPSRMQSPGGAYRLQSAEGNKHKLQALPSSISLDTSDHAAAQQGVSTAVRSRFVDLAPPGAEGPCRQPFTSCGFNSCC